MTFTTLRNKIRLYISEGHERTVKAKKHILASFFLKGSTILLAFILVPIVLQYIHKEQYGIWLTLSSILSWFAFFDIGLGHGLRNKLSEALAEKDIQRAKTYVSTTYAILTTIFSSLILLFFAVNPFLDWTIILNTSAGYFDELRLVVIIVFSCYCIRFVLQMVNIVLYANQRPSVNDFLNFISKVITFIAFLILTAYTEGSLLNISLIYGFTPLVTLLVASIIFFNGEYKSIAPSIKYVDLRYAKDLLNLGGKFFIIGIAVLIIFSTDNMIIIQIYGPSEVPAYAIAHKYFSIVTMIFTIISVPFWSAYTEAFVKKDNDWIRSTNRNLIKIWVGLCGLSFLMLMVATKVFEIWVPEIEVPFILSAFMCMYVIIFTWGTIFVTFINGVGKIKLQLIVSSIGAILNIPLSYLFAKVFGLGTPGVIIASAISIGYMPIVAPIQFRRIVNGTARGIWNK